jgi:glycosyltransferase involved in cell wall biosynthesis
LSKLRVAILADYKEEGWHSMDLVAEMIAASLKADGRVDAELIRPPMPRPFERLAGEQGRNLDRLAGRFLHYPHVARSLRKRFDVFHVTDHSYSQLVHDLPAERTIVTCHDIDTFRSLLRDHPEPRPWWFQRMAARILSGLAPDRFSVLPIGVSQEFFDSVHPDAAKWVEAWLLERDLLQKPLLLHVGSTIARKRIDTLLEVTGAVCACSPDVHLLRVGGPFTDEQTDLAGNLGLSERIHFLPFLDRVHLRAVYARANVVLQPSSYEGFGLPVAEALACGAIVVASDIPVLREIGGDAVTYCPVGAVADWQKEVERLLNLPPGEAIEHARERGRLWAKRYQWSEVANSLVYRYRYTAGIMN